MMETDADLLAEVAVLRRTLADTAWKRIGGRRGGPATYRCTACYARRGTSHEFDCIVDYALASDLAAREANRLAAMDAVIDASRDLRALPGPGGDRLRRAFRALDATVAKRDEGP